MKAVAAAVVACPSVSRLSGGTGGEIATYLPGDRVNGIRLRDDDDNSGCKAVTVSVVAMWDVASATVGDEVRAAVRTVGGPGVGRVDVSIDDVDVPDELARRLGLIAEEEPDDEATAAPTGSLPPASAEVPVLPGPSAPSPVMSPSVTTFPPAPPLSSAPPLSPAPPLPPTVAPPAGP